MNRTKTASAGLLALLLAVSLTSAGQTRISRAERDSLMDVAETRRYEGRHDEAIHIYERLGGEQARLETAATYLEKGKVLIALEQAKAMRHDALFSRKDDALLIEAECRQAQGFDRAAMRIYRRLRKRGHARATYYYANMMYTKGRDAKAEELCCEALRRDRSIAPAHRLLAAVEVARGHRYRAILPLYFYLLSCSDEGREEALPQLRSLWRREADFVRSLRHGDAADTFDDQMEGLMAELVETYDYKPGERGEADKIALMSDSIFACAERLGAENLDFWQVHYADFFGLVHRGGFTAPMVHFVCAPADKGTALAWISANRALFDDFQTWLASQLSGSR